LTLLLFGSFAYFYYQGKLELPRQIIPKQESKDSFELEKFSSEEEFRQYISSPATLNFDMGSRNLGAPQELTFEMDSQTSPLKETAERVSETNVQVSGIDEPDTVKTDGS